jgi:hypothetical protein
VNRRRFLVSAGSAVAFPAALAPAARADATEAELAYANFAIAAEYLMADYYAKVLEAKLFRGSALEGATRARFNEGEHVRALSTLLADAAQSVPAAEDFEFAWPKGTFDSLGAAAGAGARIEGAVVGAYVSAAATMSVESYRSLFARALADEAQHLTVLSWVANGKPVGNSFPQPLDLESATNVVGPYLG